MATLAYMDMGGEIVITGFNEDPIPANTEIEVPSSIEGVPVTIIGGMAFAGQANLLSVTLPASIQSIESSAFENSTNVTVTVLGNLPEYGGNLQEIGANAFTGVTSVVNGDSSYTGQPWDHASGSPQWVENLYDAAGGDGGEGGEGGEASGSGDPYVTSMLM